MKILRYLLIGFFVFGFTTMSYAVDKTLKQYGVTRILPKTEQTVEYQAGDDGTYEKGNPASPRYVDNGDGTISDKATGLMWIKQPTLIIPGASVRADNQIQVAHGDWATSHAHIIGDLVRAIEATTGVNASRAGYVVTAASGTPFSAADLGREILINNVSQGFVQVVTSSTVVKVSSTGTTASNPLTIKSFYVCVVDHTSGTFLDDLASGYWRETFWTRSAANLTTPSKMTWSNALLNSEALIYAGFSDWRLPNVKELLSIADYSVYSPAVNGTFFPNTQSDDYWSGTTYAGDTAFAWDVYFDGGDVYAGGKTFEDYVRPVRSSQ